MGVPEDSMKMNQYYRLSYTRKEQDKWSDIEQQPPFGDRK